MTPDRAARNFASFPLYDLPEMHAATDALWAALAAKLAADGVLDVPPRLDRTRPYHLADAGACVFTQTCGYPLFTTARDLFTVLGAPCYNAPGCIGPLHRSNIVVRNRSSIESLEHLRGGRFAINELDSNSGMNLPRLVFARLATGGRFFGSTVVTGSHAASAERVSTGEADAAAIDCVTFALLTRYRPAATRELRVIATTAATPTPPLVTSRSMPESVARSLRDALAAVIREPRYADICAALLLTDIHPCGATAYDIVLKHEREAQRLRYPVLA